MANSIISVITSPMNIITRPTLQIDMDVDAERFVVFDRKSLELINAGIRPPSGVVYVVVPTVYATANDLLLGILDDDGEYNAKFVDGVTATMENLVGLDMSQ